MQRATPESPRMFENDLFDFFSRVPWFIVPTIYVPLITGFLVWSMAAEGVSWWASLLIQLPLGVFVWSLMEYWLHRTLFHWEPKTWWGPKMHFILHGVHHKWFKDRFRLVMPPAASLSLAVVFFAATWGIAILLSPLFHMSWVWGFFAGVMLGYLIYDLTHYYLHHGRPKSQALKRLRAHHNAHHHNPRFAEKKFGVSNTLWDHVFGTYS